MIFYFNLPWQLKVSSLHITFNSSNEWEKLGEKGFLQRIGMQYHWKNRNYKKWVFVASLILSWWWTFGTSDFDIFFFIIYLDFRGILPAKSNFNFLSMIIHNTPKSSLLWKFEVILSDLNVYHFDNYGSKKFAFQCLALLFYC